MKPRKAAAEPGEDLDTAGVDMLMAGRRTLEALEACRGWAGRIVLAGVVGDRGGLLQDAMRFLTDYLQDEDVTRRREALSRAVTRRAPELAPAVERVLADHGAAVQRAALMLGISIGQQTRVTLDELKAARARIAFDAAGIRGEIAAMRRTLKPAPVKWRCDTERG